MHRCFFQSCSYVFIIATNAPMFFQSYTCVFKMYLLTIFQYPFYPFYLLNQSIHSPIHPFIHSPIHPFTHSSIHPFIHSIIQSFNHSIIHSSIPPSIQADVRDSILSCHPERSRRDIHSPIQRLKFKG